MSDLSACMPCVLHVCAGHGVPQELIDRFVAQDEYGITLLERAARYSRNFYDAIMLCQAHAKHRGITECSAIPVSFAKFSFPHVMMAVVSYHGTPMDVVDAVLEFSRRLDLDFRHWVFTKLVEKRPAAQIIPYLTLQYITQYYGLTSGTQSADYDYALRLVSCLLTDTLCIDQLPQEIAADLADYFINLCKKRPDILDFAPVSCLLLSDNANLTQEQKDALFCLLLGHPCSSALVDVISCVDCPDYFVQAMADIVLSDTDMPEILRLQRIAALLDYQAGRLGEHIRLALEMLRMYYLPASLVC